jgi:UDP-N-acetylglucosamine acyltransferase
MIHPSAVVAEGARLGAGVRIGPFCVLGPDVSIGDGAELISHVVVDGHAAIGAQAVIYPFATVGMAPQDLKYKGEPTRTEIGPRTVIREHCTIHRGTVTGSGVTRVGADCLLMAVVHVAHDCAIGDGVVIANNVVMGGHVEIADRAIIGGAAALHQFVRIGAGAMIGGVSGVEADVIPYGSVLGNRARLAGLNLVGLKRRGLDKPTLHAVRNAFNTLFHGEGVFAERLDQLRPLAASNDYVRDILAFIDAPSKRGLIRATIRRADDDAEA